MDHELIPYKTMPTWTATTLPEPFQKMHNTKVGTWAHLTILEGALTFYELDEDGNVLAQHLFTKDSEIPFVEPQAWHRVSPASDDLKCYLTFYCTPEDYFAKKYDLTRTHSEVIEATPKFHKGCARFWKWRRKKQLILGEERLRCDFARHQLDESCEISSDCGSRRA